MARRAASPADEGLLARAWAALLRLKARIRFKSRVSEVTSGAFLLSILNRFGYTIVPSGQSFIDATSTIAAARAAGMSICDYRESRDDPRLRGRRDLIIETLKTSGLLDNVEATCEIGAGTGMYLERVIELARPRRYEVYETSPGWASFLRSEYDGRAGCRVVCQPADGVSLRQTADSSMDLVQAHGVFIYLPMLSTIEYLTECVRVCRPNGHILFDCFLDPTFSSMDAVDAWRARGWRFPVVIPERLLDAFAERHRLEKFLAFSVPYSGGTSDYIVWRKLG